jgi:hypothetical protein
MGLCRFFHETWRFFKDLELAVIEDYDFFHIPGMSGSAFLNFFKYLKLAGITKIKYSPHTGVNLN